MFQNSKIMFQHINKLSYNNSLNDLFIIIDFAVYKQLRYDSSLFNPLLNCDHPFYNGKTLDEISICKAYLFNAFETIGTAKNTLPYLIEIIECSTSPLLVAAAAKGIRGVRQSSPQLAPILIEGFYSIQRIKEENNCSTNFNNDKEITAINEILLTLKWFGKDLVYLLPELQIIKKEFSSKLDIKNLLLLQNTIQFLENVKDPIFDYSKLSLEEYYNINNYITINKNLSKNKGETKSLLNSYFFNYFSFFNRTFKLT